MVAISRESIFLQQKQADSHKQFGVANLKFATAKERPLSQKHPSSSPTTLTLLLSLTWVLLCTGLVIKYPPLVRVFMVFVSCWLVCFLWHYVMFTPQEGNCQQQQSSTIVLWLCCAYQVYQLVMCENPYAALCTSAGYLAFDHWFVALKGTTPPSTGMATENAFTLTVFVILLVLSHHHTDQEDNDDRCLRMVATLWTVYKILRLLLAPSTTTTLDDKKMKGKRWIIHGKEYDLSSFVHRHPGGKEAILLGCDRPDCTALFESYHPFSKQRVRKVLEQYAVVTLSSKVPATPTSHDPFYDTMCQRVEETLRLNGMDPIRDRSASISRRLYYCTIIAAVLLCSYYHAKASTLASYGLAIFGWLLGALGHDAGHFSASRTPWINDVCVWAMGYLCNPLLWQHQHTFAHHSYTNDVTHDPDLHHFTTLLRVHAQFQQAPVYRYQSHPFYVFFAYMFVVFGTCVWIPWGMMKEGTLYGLVEWTDRQRPVRALGMYTHWILYTGFLIVWPFWVHPTWYAALGTVLLHVGTSGLIFALFSQINHLNEPSLQQKPKQRSSWAAHQVATSNNFCPRSRLWHVLSNGLNLQIEHHLFPGLNHCHLAIIQPTVQQVCEEHGIHYKSYETWGDIMQATLDWLQVLSEAVAN